MQLERRREREREMHDLKVMNHPKLGGYMDNKVNCPLKYIGEGPLYTQEQLLLTYLPSLFCELYVFGDPSEPPLTSSLTISAG